MSTRIVTTKHIAQSATTFVGRDGELIIDDVNNTLKISDGTTAGGVVLTGGVQKVAVPANNYGVTGNKAGMVAFDASYIYYCFADYSGSMTISNVSTQASGTANGYFFNVANANLSVVIVGWTITGPNITGSATITQISYSNTNEWEFQTNAGSVDLRNQSGYTLSGYPAIWKRTAHGNW
jgi:hypothetical protein